MSFVEYGKEPHPMQVLPEDPLLQFFSYSHLRDDLKDTSAKFHSLANWIANELPRNPERTVALRKLLEAKDCAIRARLFK